MLFFVLRACRLPLPLALLRVIKAVNVTFFRHCFPLQSRTGCLEYHSHEKPCALTPLQLETRFGDKITWI